MLRTFSEIYRGVLYSTMGMGVQELNERTQTKVAIMPGGIAFTLDLSDGKVPTPGCRRVFPKTAATEIAWFLSGSQDVTFLRAHNVKIWNPFVEEDTNIVDAAYGYRWRQHFGRDQIGLAVEALKANPSDRRVKISAWDPARDGLGVPSKNVPCPCDFTFNIVSGKLHSTVLLRSSDIFVGLPYDVMGHALLTTLVANSIGCEVGTLQMCLAHAHLYECHFEMALECLKQDHTDDQVALPAADWTIDRVTKQPDSFVELYKGLCEAVTTLPEYNPKPSLVK